MKMLIENLSTSARTTRSNSNDLTKKINHYLMSEIFTFFNLDELFHMMQVNTITRDCVLKMKLVKHLVSMILDPKITSHFLLSNNASMLTTYNQSASKEIQNQSAVFNDFLLFNLLCADIKTVNRERVLKLPSGLGEKGVGFVSRVLLSLNIDVLDCTSSKIGNRGLEVLLDKVKQHKQIKHLILCDCYLSIEGMSALNRGSPYAMTSLDLSNNHFEAEAYQELAELLAKPQCSIDTLNMANNKMKGDGLGKIAQALVKHAKMKVINLKGNDIGDNGCQPLADVLYANKQLIGIDLSKNKLSLNGLTVFSKQLKNHPALVELNLQGNILNAESCTELAKIILENTTIKELNLSANKLSEKGCLLLSDSLRANSSITHLLLQGNNIEDLGAKYILTALSESDVIESLDLSNNALTEGSSEIIADFLMKSTSLVSLSLANNELATLSAISSAFEENDKVEQLDISNNSLGDEEVITLCESLEKRKKLISLNISCNELSNAVLPSVTSLVRSNLVVKLFLNGNGLDKSGIKSLGEAISETSTITAFDISSNSLGDEGIKDLIDQLFSQQRLHLQYINLGKNAFNKATIKKLEQLNESNRYIMLLYK